MKEGVYVTEFNPEDKAFTVEISHSIGICNVGKKNKKRRGVTWRF